MRADDTTRAHAAPDADVRPMRELRDFKVVETDPDVRGWVVRQDGVEVGRVSDLMVDTAAMRVRYIDVALTQGGQHILIPVEDMQADASERAVSVATVNERTLAPSRPANASTPHSTTAAGAAHVQVNDDEIRVPVVEEELVVEKRPVVKEELVVKKAAVTREQRVEADLRKEQVDISRTDRNANPQ